MGHYFFLIPKAQQLVFDFYQLYLEKNGKTVYTVQQFLNDYILKYPELSLDEAVNLLSDKIRNIETFITYK